MSIRYLIAAALVTSAFAGRPADAQKKSVADTVTPRFTIGSTQVAAGYINFDFAALDARLAAAGLPRAASATATIGLGTDIRAGALLLGVGFQSLITRDQRDASYRTRLSGRQTTIDFGAAVLRSRNWSVYPLVGFGATSLSVNLRERGDFTFDEALDRPGRELGMSGIGALAHGGLLIERRLRRGETEFALALRAGMTHSFGSQLWSSDASKVDGGPSGIDGYYVRLMFSRPMRHRRDALVPFAGTVAQAAIR